VVLHGGDEDFVAGFDVFPAVCHRDEVDRLGGAAHEDDLTCFTSVQECTYLFTGRFEGFRGALRKLVDPAVDVRVVPAVELGHRVDHLLRLLCARGAVQEDEWVAVALLVENREIATNSFDVEARSGRLLAGGTHAVSRPAARSAPSTSCLMCSRRDSPGIRSITSDANA